MEWMPETRDAITGNRTLIAILLVKETRFRI